MLKTAQTGDFRPGQLNDDGTGTGVHRWALQEVINMHKTTDDARMGMTWRLHHGKVYLDRARFFVERCASAKGQPKLQCATVRLAASSRAAAEPASSYEARCGDKRRRHL
jgi:hypothetical protein